MIRYIKLKNYRSFTDLTFNLMSKNGVPKKLAIIYGENGSGKSNLISVFDTLYESFETMNIKKVFMRLLEEHPDLDITKRLRAINPSTDITRTIHRNKTSGSTDNMVIELGFYLDGKNGTYLIEFDSDQIVHERLEYTLNRNRGIYFDIKKDEVRINSSVFSDFKKEFIDMISKYWGKHSAISLINYAREEYTIDYIESKISSVFFNLLDYLNSVYIYLTDQDYKRGVINSNNSLSPDKYISGEIPSSEEFKLNHTEKMLNKFFKSIYKNVHNVFYEREIINDMIKYELYFTRYISGKERIIHHSDESCGTKNLILLLPYCIAATQGHVVTIDEIDNGIHDVLLCNMLKALYKNISGQVILTTHNTLLLNEYDFKDAYYFIEMDDKGTRRINTPSDFNYRIQPDSNVILNYLLGKFKGLPWNSMDINFQDISSTEE